MLSPLDKSSQMIEIEFAGHPMWLDARGTVYWPDRETLIVSDLHLEKASFLAAAGHPLPHYDTLDTLARLQRLLEEYRPAHVVCLGDSFHDGRAAARMEGKLLARLNWICDSCQRWTWILGNHDSVIPDAIKGQRKNSLRLAQLLLVHEPEAIRAPQIIGHFHPKMKRRVAGQRITGKCFLSTPRYLFMPAFGSFTGGLDIEDEVIKGISGLRQRKCYLIWKEKIWSF